MRRRALIGSLAGLAAGSVGYMLALGAWQAREQQAADDPRPLPLTEMGWRLTDHRGQPVTPADWQGRPVMVFFGFTFCPDICPTTLLNISDWMATLGVDADRLTAALVTVDPARDTPEALADYLSNFDPRIIGLTGSAEDIARITRDFRATYQQVPTGDGDYTMDHTAGVFLFRPDGRLANVIDFHENPALAVPKIRRVLR